MPGIIVSRGNPDIVNLIGNQKCCSCGNVISKRKKMWKFSDGNYICIPCKTHFDENKAKGTSCSADADSIAK